MSSTDSKSKPCDPNEPTKEEKRWGVFYLNKYGVSQMGIAEIVGLPRSTVQNIISRIKETGSPTHRKSPGAPKKITKRAQRQIERAVKKDPSITSGKLKSELKEAGLEVSKTTIASSLKKKPT